LMSFLAEAIAFCLMRHAVSVCPFRPQKSQDGISYFSYDFFPYPLAFEE
jgi:hypothetical protein